MGSLILPSLMRNADLVKEGDESEGEEVEMGIFLSEMVASSRVR